MSQEQWNEVDDYINGLFVPADPALDDALKASDAAGLPTIAVAPNQGKLLHILAKSIKAKKILEIGTLGGYSTIWLARALPKDGHLVTLEFDPKHATVARANIAHAGLTQKVKVRVGRAVDSLQQLETEHHGTFDLIFIDADKPGYPEYLRWALKFSHSGTMIIADNVIRDGEVVDADSEDEKVQGVHRFNALLAAESRVTATIIQTVGSKGYDGLAVAVVN
jgi:predicted O-methyltransferase YrrM